MIEIKCRLTDRTLLTVDTKSLFGIDLSGVRLAGAYLCRADLSGANLAGADFCDANLSGANLTGVDLSGATLLHADLMGACLRNASLASANLAGAGLARARLDGANLQGAKLRDAHLFRTDLTDTFLGETDLTDTVFASCRTPHKARGLEEAGRQGNRHGSAVLDHRTLRACVRYLPDAFLRNVGYRQEEIVALRELYGGRAAAGLVMVECDVDTS